MLLTKMLAIIAMLNTLVAERAELIRFLAIALLTRKNLFVLGGTGQAKSYVINLVCKCIVGAKLFTRLLTKQTDEESLFGRIDLKSYIEGTPKMITTGKIPESHIIFLDETFKCNDGVLNANLTAMNERKYTNESETLPIPAISFIGASNEIPDFSDKENEILRPLYDRFDLKVVTHDVDSCEERLRIMKLKRNKAAEEITTTITLDELRSMQDEVASIAMPDPIDKLMDNIFCELRRLGINVSNRKLFNYSPVVQAEAWLRGRDTVEVADLMILKCYFWTKPEEIPVIQQVLEQFCANPVEERLKDIAVMAKETNDEFNTAVKTKPTKALMKLRGEFVHLYTLLMQMETETHDKESKTAVTKAINSLEKMSRAAHAKCNFTYDKLSELADLQGECV